MPKYRRQVFTIEVLAEEYEDGVDVAGDIVDMLNNDFMFTGVAASARVLHNEVTKVGIEEAHELFGDEEFPL